MRPHVMLLAGVWFRPVLPSEQVADDQDDAAYPQAEQGAARRWASIVDVLSGRLPKLLSCGGTIARLITIENRESARRAAQESALCTESS